MAEATAPLAEVQNLSVDFHTRHGIVHAVRDVSWSIHRGECLAILGESGSGKSVTAAAVMGLIDTPPGNIAAGRIMFHGEDLLKLSPEARRDINGRKIAMVFQDPLAALNPVYPIGWQVAETLRAHHIGSAEARARALDLLVRVGIPDAKRRFGDYPHQFSGGQRQRIMIAMALGLKPDLLIADEPTTALDVTVQAQILRLIKELQDETGMGLLLITHDMGVVAEIAERVVVMKDGGVIETGPVRQVFKSPQQPYTQQLIDAVPRVRSGAWPADQQRPSTEVVLDVRGLSKHYQMGIGLFGGSVEVVRGLDGVTFDLRQGETLAIVGESGSGKSTLARTLLGLSDPTEGTATYRGQDLFHATATERMALRRRIQAVFQDPASSLNPRMYVGDVIAEPWIIHHDPRSDAERKADVGKLLVQVGLSPAFANRYPHQLSGGQQQRVAIARALALRPELIVFDEAVSALDVSIQAQVIALLKELRTEFGLSYLFIAHDLAVVRGFAHRVLVMRRGKIVEQGSTEQIFDHPQEPYTQELIAAMPDPDPDVHAARRAAEIA